MGKLVYGLDASKMLQLEEKMASYPGDVEKAVNEVIHNRGSKHIMMSILNLAPRSTRQKKHAKDSDSFMATNINLGVVIQEKNNFGYLVFPDMGIGRRNRVEQNFTEEGLRKSEDVVFQWILEALEKTF